MQIEMASKKWKVNMSLRKELGVDHTVDQHEVQYCSVFKNEAHAPYYVVLESQLSI